jgi:predicted nucleic-acid-binding Zn-ribbon protein
MQCPKCGSTNVLTESLEEGRVKVTCQNCGHSEVKDPQGRQMLTDNMPQPDRREYLTEG